MARTAIALLLIATATCARAQWQMQDSGTTASLRGIHAVSNNVAWASGTEGTVLRTIDGGAHWHKCAVPEGAEKLDFRGVWAWSNEEAMVMSSGPGDQSRLYKTGDGCARWTLLQKNTDKEGFWDAVVFHELDGVLIGDPVGGRFYAMPGELAAGPRAGELPDRFSWFSGKPGCSARDGEAAFAASNSSVYVFGSDRYILGTGGKGGPRALLSAALAGRKDCLGVPVPVSGGNDSSGIFSMYFRDRNYGVAVGGDYKQPNKSDGTAAFTSDGGLHWTAASKPPHGYRSSVSWCGKTTWIAVGTNGSDISPDDGKTWQPLDNGNWNAVSLPFVVGPKGRIARTQCVIQSVTSLTRNPHQLPPGVH